MKLPYLESLGLGLSALKAANELPLGFESKPNLIGAYAYAKELSSAKDFWALGDDGRTRSF